MYIETSRLVIRNFMSNDAADLHEILGDDETMENCEPAYDFEKTEKFLNSFCIDCNGAVGAIHKDSNKLIGYILFNGHGDGVYEMGWIFNRNFWRQGYAYEACKAVIDCAFGKLGANRIFAETVDNVKSVSLMRKLGMSFEGIQHSPPEDNNGIGTDLYFYGLLKAAWRKQCELK